MTRTWRAALLGSLLAAGPANADQSTRLLFTGDILLAREVAHEIAAKPGQSPWAAMRPVFAGADWIMGNLEGTVGDPAGCPPPTPKSAPCFGVKPALLSLAHEAGFQALGLANNHSGDLGPAGRAATAPAVAAGGMLPIGLEQSPTFVKRGDAIIGLVSLTLVAGPDGRRQSVPSVEIGQKLGLARALADWVVVFVHWGSERIDWPTEEQTTAAHWLVSQGADLIIGAHPHVVEAPDCVDGKPVFYSLGNHLFDQKYPETKQGLVAECRIQDGQLSCGGIATETPAGSSFPHPVAKPSADLSALAACHPHSPGRLAISGVTLAPRLTNRAADSSAGLVVEGTDGSHHWAAPRRQVLRLERARFLGRDYLFALERYPSPIDKETGPRPFVYEVTPTGLIARWRGSALAWPLIDARPLLTADGDTPLCALHRADSFVTLAPGSEGTRVALYRWNGFGFSGLEDAGLLEKCRQLVAGEEPQ